MALTKKKVEDIYKKQTLHESILNRPDTYVGSDKAIDTDMYLFDDETKKIVRKNIQITPALLKIFDEAIVNAADQITRTADLPKGKRVSFIKVNIDKEKGSIEIINDGPGIPVKFHNEEKMYVPELIFGTLLTSSNYNKEEKKLTGGKNGVGIKLAAIFSTKFIVETVDSDEKKKFIMSLENNMYKRNKPKITVSNKKSYTSVKFFPDFKRFNLEKFTDDIYSVLKRRVYDISACTATAHNIKVYFNDELVPIKKFEDYIRLYFDDEKLITFEKLNDRWEVGVAVADDNFEQVSFVNYINTYGGGKHVNYVSDKIVAEIKKIGEKKFKTKNIKSSIVKNKLFVFVNSLIENPSFESQSKEILSTPVKDFGSTVDISDSFMKKFKKSGILDEIEAIVMMKEKLEAKKTSGKKVNKLHIPKLDDARKAGTAEAYKCSLILTEGDSAKTFAVNGLQVIGNTYYGVFPLKGKLINTRVQSQAKVNKNEEINNLKKILGLEHGKKYESVKDLRYGKIIILTDQDVDGSHIKGLVMNWIHDDWPELLKLGFVTSLLTPIIKVFKKVGSKKLEKAFYTLSEYEEWKKGNMDGYGNAKYYKGLGTSEPKEHKEAFQNFEEKMVHYVFDDKTNKTINEAFDKDFSNIRKEWLMEYDPDNIIMQSEKNVTITDFIRKDLIHFSQYDIVRSIPSLIDGFKPSQRKVLYTALKRYKTTKAEIKVSQFTGYVSAETDYHHGEASLNGTIIKMAQDYVGSNNINLLMPNGSFGSRQQNGSDFSSPRYIYTVLSPIVNKIFIDNDNKILDYQHAESLKIEPIWYMPILPMILVNGAKGIGTGFSTEIMQYNVKDIISVLYDLMENSETKSKEIMPYHEGWAGTVTKDAKSFTFTGTYEVHDKDKCILVTELPVSESFESYKNFLTDLEDKKLSFHINSFKYIASTSEVYYKIYFSDVMYKKVKKNIPKLLKLQSKTSITNMYLFNEDNVITKYNSVFDIIDAFYKLRVKFYNKRKRSMIKDMEDKTDVIKTKHDFIMDVINKNIIVIKKTKKEVEKQLETKKYLMQSNSYDYLTGLPIYSLTCDHAEKLKNDLIAAEKELNRLKKLNIITQWKTELKDLLTAYEAIADKNNKDREESRQELRDSNKTFFKFK